MVTQYQQDALVEEYIDGREVNIGILGNDPPELFPIVEIDFGNRQPRAMTRADKYHKSPDEPAKICPAPMSGELAGRLSGLALATFRTCRCRDYARIDIRIDPEGNPFVLEINSMASLGATEFFVYAAEKAGYSFTTIGLSYVITKARRHEKSARSLHGHIRKGHAGWMICRKPPRFVSFCHFMEGDNL